MQFPLATDQYRVSADFSKPGTKVELTMTVLITLLQKEHLSLPQMMVLLW
ncbi:hypothetical protein P4V40_06350 [Brevibacillus laterosporus]|nr:hypothetical protein [Brevibacillus laterosporus]MED1910327.1 hypothetical protein [Brevibacillus laterosporus]